MKSSIPHTTWLGLLLLLSFTITNCNNQQSENKENKTLNNKTVAITKSTYGRGFMVDGKTIDQYTLKNSKGMEVDVITYGGIITRWTAPDKEGNYENIVLGFGDNFEQYINSTPYFGAIIGRYGNRIAKGEFEIDGISYQLATNNGPNHLHGGINGFDKVVWNAVEAPSENKVSLILSYTSVDGEEGYPGNLKTTVVYTLTNDNEFIVEYDANTDQKTIVNLTQHSYFNLSGDFTQPILDHALMIDADEIVPVDETLIPTGAFMQVKNTPFDFREFKPIGQDINAEDEQLRRGRGFDHCWVLNNQGSFKKVAAAYHPGTGRLLEIFTDEPGIQFYCGNFLDGTLPMPGGGVYAHRTGFCMETQHYPDSPNQKAFPSVLLSPGEKYTSKTIFKFSTK